MLKILNPTAFFLLISITILAQSTEYQQQHQFIILNYLNDNSKNIFIKDTIENKTDGINGNFNLTVKANFKMKICWIVNNQKEDFFTTLWNDEYNFTNLQEGSYKLITMYYDLDPEERYYSKVYYKEFDLLRNDTLEIIFREANKTKLFNLKRFDSTPLLISSFDITFIDTIINKGFIYTKLSMNYRINNLFEEFFIDYNEFPPETFIKHWNVIGKQPINNGDLYILNGEFKNDDESVVIENNPQNYSHVVLNYHLPDSAINSDLFVATFPGGHSYQDDPIYDSPLSLSIYQDTSASIDLYYSRFFQNISVSTNTKDYLTSLPIRLGGNKTYGFPDSSNKKFTLFETDNVTLGLSPLFWYGQFENKDNQIEITSSWGIRNVIQLFLTQTNDVISNYPPNIIIKKEKDEVIINKEIKSDIYSEYPAEGYHPDSLIYSVEPGWYKVTITNAKNEVSVRKTVSQAIAEFNLKNTDKNPPYLKQYQILASKNPANLLNSEKPNFVRFIADDNLSLVEAHLFYQAENDSAWIELPLYINNEFFESKLPKLSDGYYSLKTLLKDISSNKLSVIMQPAFYYENTTSVKNKNEKLKAEFEIFNCYPNPFNSVTTITYNLIKAGLVTINVFDVLGNRIAKLFSEKQTSGIHKVLFNTTEQHIDEKSISSGIYFINISTSQGVKTIKVVLIK